MTQAFVLPWPVSANRLWRSYRGRVVCSREYKNWRDIAGKTIMQLRPKRHRGPVEVSIELGAPTKWQRYDPDNKTKSVLDLLVAMQIIESDDSKTVKKISVCEGSGFIGARVTVSPWGAA